MGEWPGEKRREALWQTVVGVRDGGKPGPGSSYQGRTDRARPRDLRWSQGGDVDVEAQIGL
jgi:hypothetical protein